jgi:hypothetical protein
VIGRLARTVARLHPLQIAARGPHTIVARSLRDVSGRWAPRVIDAWPAVPEALTHLARAERIRGAERLARLPVGSRLRAYEGVYGLELGADEMVSAADWSSRVAVEPYPASIRARRIAVAVRCGRSGLEIELARAARAVLLQAELHLLGNHLVENGLALACAGAVTRGPEATLWWEAGVRLLAWQLPEQFLSDGGHVERSASYQVALLAGLLEAIELADAGGRRAPPEWRETAGRAAPWARAVRAPDGTYPLFNDAALDAAPSVDDVLALAAAVGSAAPQETESGGERGAVRVTRIEPTGWVRVDWADGTDACLFLDAGPDAEGWQPGHAHADGLSFELWVRGVRTVVDYGVATYEAGAAREATRATRSHNTAELDGVDSCEVWSAFRVGRRGRGRVVACVVREDTARIELEHDGYAWRAGSPRHVRVLTMRAGQLFVQDRIISGRGEFVSRVRFHAAAAGQTTVAGNRHVSQRDDAWHPRHGEARPAIVLEQRGVAGDERDVEWRIGW